MNGRFVTRLIADDRAGAFTAVGESTPICELVAACAAAAGTTVELVPVPYALAPKPFPLVKAEVDWPTQRRSPDPARAAGLPVTDLAVTAADVLAWDRERGEPPLQCGFTEAQEERLRRNGSGHQQHRARAEHHHDQYGDQQTPLGWLDDRGG